MRRGCAARQIGLVTLYIGRPRRFWAFVWASALGWALGGEVCPNPNGGEVGTIQVDLNAAGQADYLFQGLPNPIVVQSIHNDIVMELPKQTV